MYWRKKMGENYGADRCDTQQVNRIEARSWVQVDMLMNYAR